MADKCRLDHCGEFLTSKSAKGLCPGHYQRWRKYGDKFNTLPLRGKGATAEGVFQGKKYCSTCLSILTLEEFIPSSPSLLIQHPELTHSSKCRSCASKRRRTINTVRNFGEGGRILDVRRLEGEGCAVCGNVDSKLGVDHDHSCCSNYPTCGKCSRDLLCGRCNTALGLCDDDPVRLRDLADYVEKWKLRHAWR